MRAHAADRVFRIVMALASPSASARRTGPVILTAKLIAAVRDAQGERREPRPGRSRCRCALDPDPGSEMGTSPGSSSGPARERPRGQTAAAQVARAQKDVVARNVRVPIPASR